MSPCHYRSWLTCQALPRRGHSYSDSSARKCAFNRFELALELLRRHVSQHPTPVGSSALTYEGHWSYVCNHRLGHLCLLRRDEHRHHLPYRLFPLPGNKKEVSGRCESSTTMKEQPRLLMNSWTWCSQSPTPKREALSRSLLKEFFLKQGRPRRKRFWAEVQRRLLSAAKARSVSTTPARPYTRRYR